MKSKMDELLRHALFPKEEPDERLNQKILYQAEEMADMAKKRYGRVPAAILAASLTLAIGSTAVFAAWKYLSPAQVAEELNDRKLVEAFQGEDAVSVDETQEYGGYRVTLLGAVSGKNISEYMPADGKGNVKEDRFYAVVAMERADGVPMPSTGEDAYGDNPLYVSPYIKGLDPKRYSLMNMGGGYSEFVQDGIQYRLLDMENIEIFADKGIYIGVSSGSFYDSDAYNYDESTGEITRNTSYDGVNALFILPLDKSKADPEAAKAFLEEVDNPAEDEEPMEKTEVDILAEEYIKKLTTDNLDEYAERIENTVQICRPDADGAFAYSWELDNGAGSEGIGDLDVSFPDRKPGTCVINGFSYSEDGLKGMNIETFTLNEDGTVTVAVYRPKQSEWE